MPKRTDIHSILIIGSGPIVIGQACEFDYSGTQACRVLREEGYRVILVNSNPATIMTDPDFADATYIEPITPEVVAKIIERERPDAVLPTLGGQTGLNTAMALFERGLIGVPGTPEMIGANAEAIATAEDRDKFKQAMIEIGLSVPVSGIAHTLEEATAVVERIGLPIIIRPAYILGGRGTGIASTPEEFEARAAEGLAASPISEILIEKSIAGWKEYELEVMRDRADNCVIICSIENVDAMGVHTGDSITVAPAQTLSDVEYQQMRDAAFVCIRRVGVETGGSNVQFAVNPQTGEQVIIEMNPRVSRSSALASKATGFPIAKIAAKLAVGYTLDEIENDITATATSSTPASFEPSIDYVVTKIPRWAFEKLPGSSGILGTQMQSVGEVMAIGRTFAESLQKGLRSLEQGRLGLGCDPAEAELADIDDDTLTAMIVIPTPDRIFQVGELLRRGVTIEVVHEACKIDAWFLDQMMQIVEERAVLAETKPDELTSRQWRRAKQMGFSDGQLAHLWDTDELNVREIREGAGVSAANSAAQVSTVLYVGMTPAASRISRTFSSSLSHRWASWPSLNPICLARRHWRDVSSSGFVSASDGPLLDDLHHLVEEPRVDLARLVNHLDRDATAQQLADLEDAIGRRDRDHRRSRCRRRCRPARPPPDRNRDRADPAPTSAAPSAGSRGTCDRSPSPRRPIASACRGRPTSREASRTPTAGSW